MPSQPPLPPPLLPYFSLPPSTSLTLLTSTLGASANWLLLRFVYAALKNLGHDRDDDSNRDIENTRVVLVSWLRDANWWREGGRKLGINTQKVQIVEALNSGLGLGHGGLADVGKELLKAVTAAKEATKREGEVRILLVLDGLDFLLVATGRTVLEIMDLVGEAREHVHCTLLTSYADLSFTQSPTTPLEISQTAFVMGMAHQARMVLSVRELDTGAAKDISGVLRICRGAGWEDDEEDGEGKVDGDVVERECLYFVGADGGARVFERGA